MPDGIIKYAALCLTHNCNLRCRYCYAGSKVNKKMSFETARKAIDFLDRHSDTSCTVTLFGGEPLLEYDLIREIVPYSQNKYGRKIQFRMTTNGTLLTEDMLSFFSKHEIFFALSLDGNQQQHDSMRLYDDQRGSYSSIEAKLAAILKFNPYTVAISVVVPQTAPLISAGVQHLFAQDFRYVVQTLDYSAAWRSDHLRILKRQYQELAAYYSRCLAQGDKIYYSPFDERIKTWAQKPYEKGELCDLANTQIAIAASGRIYPCVQFVADDDATCEAQVIGDVSAGFSEDRRAYFIGENLSDRESCIGCSLDGRCATYCGCVNWHSTGSLNRIPPILCEHERMLMPIVDQMANQLWKKNVPLFKRKFYDKTFPVSSYIEDCLIRREKADDAGKTR